MQVVLGVFLNTTAFFFKVHVCSDEGFQNVNGVSLHFEVWTSTQLLRLRNQLSKYVSKDLDAIRVDRGHLAAPHSPVWSGTTMGVVSWQGFQMARFQEYMKLGRVSPCFFAVFFFLMKKMFGSCMAIKTYFTTFGSCHEPISKLECHTLPETNSEFTPENRPFAPKGNDLLQTIPLQVPAVSCREG